MKKFNVLRTVTVFYADGTQKRCFRSEVDLGTAHTLQSYSGLVWIAPNGHEWFYGERCLDTDEELTDMQDTADSFANCCWQENKPAHSILVTDEYATLNRSGRISFKKPLRFVQQRFAVDGRYTIPGPVNRFTESF